MQQNKSEFTIAQMEASQSVVNCFFVALAILAVVGLCVLMTTITLDSTFVVEQCSNKYPRQGETCFFGQVRAIANPHYATPGAPANYTPPLALPTSRVSK